VKKNMMGGGMNGLMMGGGMIGMVALWGILIWAAVSLAARVPRGDASRRDSALDILEQRFARGEIERDELELRRRTLQNQ
jgi:putative membrane protein